MTEQDYTNILIKNPKYTSPWIGKASAILTKFDESNLEDNIAWVDQYNYEQLVSISDMLEYNESAEHKIDLDVYADPKLNGTQMQLFLNVFQKVQDDRIEQVEESLRSIVNPKYTYETLNWICSALVDGLNLTPFIDDFDPNQIAEIYSGYRDKVNYTLYLKPEIPAKVMNLIRHALSIGYIEVDYDTETNTITFMEASNNGE